MLRVILFDYIFKKDLASKELTEYFMLEIKVV